MDGRAASRGTAPSIDLRSPRQQSQSIDRYHRAIDSSPHFWCDVYVFKVSHPIESDIRNGQFAYHTKEHTMSTTTLLCMTAAAAMALSVATGPVKAAPTQPVKNIVFV